MVYETNLPDVSQWVPRANQQETLKNALMMTCMVAQRRIVARAEAEIAFNVDNFDSGPGVEDIVREELANLLPQRYRTDGGVINDHLGRTAGDCDIIVRDDVWSPVIKQAATNQSRRAHFPVEGIYAVIEVKQTLGLKELDEAMKKLVLVSRLERPDNPYGHITENQHISNFDKEGQLLNPLHTTVMGTRLATGLTFEGGARRFGAVNTYLDRNHMVNLLCVLDQGTAWYSNAIGTPFDADFMRDRQLELILQVNGKEPDHAFYRLYTLIANHLTRSVLGLTGIFHRYGTRPPPRVTIRYPDAKFNRNPI